MGNEDDPFIISLIVPSLCGGNEDDPFIISLIVPSLCGGNEDDPFIISLIVPSLCGGNEDDPFIISLIVPSLCRWCAQSDSVFATIGYAVQVKVHHTGHQKVNNMLRLLGHWELMIVSCLGQWLPNNYVSFLFGGGGGEV